MGYFKYCAESGVLILKNLQLKVTPPNQFNDPFEFSPVVRNPNPTEYARKCIEQVSTDPGFFEANRLQFPGIKNFQEFQALATANDSKMLTVFEAQMPQLDRSLDVLNTISHNTGIVCFSTDPAHPLMWAHYATSHKGIAVEFDETAPLFNPIAFLKVDYDVARVVYNPDGPDQRNVVELFAKRKSRHWEYEQEFRLLVELAQTHRQVSDGKTIYLMDIAPNLIKSVTLGLRATDETRKEVLSLGNKAPLTHVRVFEILADDNEFKLHRSQIN
jgi:hypothetical protein